MFTILTKKDLIDLSQSNSKTLSFESFKLPALILEISNEILYLNGDNSQVIKTSQGHSSVSEFQQRVIWQLVNNQSFDKVKSLFQDLQGLLTINSFVKVD